MLQLSALQLSLTIASKSAGTNNTTALNTETTSNTMLVMLDFLVAVMFPTKSSGEGHYTPAS
jgi:hypothetical protein